MFDCGQNNIKTIMGLMFFLFPAQVAMAWGPEGHSIVGEIAQRHLLPEIQRKVVTDFNIKSLASISDWADQVKDSNDQKNRHFTNIEESAREYDQKRDCLRKECVTEAIPYYAGILEDRAVSLNERKDALKYLVHYVADVHQPLHLGNKEDHGGNDIPLIYAGKHTNLHALWDTDLIPHQKGKSLVEYARELDGRIRDQDILHWMHSQSVDWTNESRQLALDFAYSISLNDEGEVSEEYALNSREIIEIQLCRAGIRLAGLLNQSLK